MLHKQIIIISFKILTSAYIVYKEKISDMLKKSLKIAERKPFKEFDDEYCYINPKLTKSLRRIQKGVSRK